MNILNADLEVYWKRNVQQAQFEQSFWCDPHFFFTEGNAYIGEYQTRKVGTSNPEIRTKKQTEKSWLKIA